jgi:hypothetical protein
MRRTVIPRPVICIIRNTIIVMSDVILDKPDLKRGFIPKIRDHDFCLIHYSSIKHKDDRRRLTCAGKQVSDEMAEHGY